MGILTPVKPSNSIYVYVVSLITNNFRKFKPICLFKAFTQAWIKLFLKRCGLTSLLFLAIVRNSSSSNTCCTISEQRRNWSLSLIRQFNLLWDRIHCISQGCRIRNCIINLLPSSALITIRLIARRIVALIRIIFAHSKNLIQIMIITHFF